MFRVAVIGANGQVGSEVCLFLSKTEGIDVVPICRTELASAFLRRCGLDCRHGRVDQADKAARLVGDCDLIADFSLPRGLPAQVRRTTATIIRNVLEQSAPKARFVYISSINSFGMGPASRQLRKYMFAHSLYGQSKRYGEKLVLREGRRNNKEVFVLRLGQVHGELQSASRLRLRRLRDGPVHVPAGVSYTVFAFTVAEALANIVAGKEKPGVYTLVSTPPWTWEEVHDYYCRRTSVQQVKILCAADGVDGAGWWRRALVSALRRVARRTGIVVSQHAELIGGYLLRPFPGLQMVAAARLLSRRAAVQIADGQRRSQYRPYDVYHGDIPGRRLLTLSDTRTSMHLLTEVVRRILREASMPEGTSQD